MWKRLFLAGTITFPLYLIVHIDGLATTSALLQPKLTEKATQVASKLKEEISQIHQELPRLKNPSRETQSFFIN